MWQYRRFYGYYLCSGAQLKPGFDLFLFLEKVPDFSE